jgi:ABC-2 type transport system ATP-binding protein
VLADAEDRDAAARVLAEVAVDDVRIGDNGRELTAAVSGTATGDLLRVLQGFERETVTVLDVGLRRPTLDDVFLALTGHAAENGTDDDNDDTDASKMEAAR